MPRQQRNYTGADHFGNHIDDGDGDADTHYPNIGTDAYYLAKEDDIDDIDPENEPGPSQEKKRVSSRRAHTFITGAFYILFSPVGMILQYLFPMDSTQRDAFKRETVIRIAFMLATTAAYVLIVVLLSNPFSLGITIGIGLALSTLASFVGAIFAKVVDFIMEQDRSTEKLLGRYRVLLPTTFLAGIVFSGMMFGTFILSSGHSAIEITALGLFPFTALPIIAIPLGIIAVTMLLAFLYSYSKSGAIGANVNPVGRLLSTAAVGISASKAIHGPILKLSAKKDLGRRKNGGLDSSDRLEGLLNDVHNDSSRLNGATLSLDRANKSSIEALNEMRVSLEHTVGLLNSLTGHVRSTEYFAGKVDFDQRDLNTVLRANKVIEDAKKAISASIKLAATTLETAAIDLRKQLAQNPENSLFILERVKKAELELNFLREMLENSPTVAQILEEETKSKLAGINGLDDTKAAIIEFNQKKSAIATLKSQTSKLQALPEGEREKAAKKLQTKMKTVEEYRTYYQGKAEDKAEYSMGVVFDAIVQNIDRVLTDAQRAINAIIPPSLNIYAAVPLAAPARAQQPEEFKDEDLHSKQINGFVSSLFKNVAAADNNVEGARAADDVAAAVPSQADVSPKGDSYKEAERQWNETLSF